MNEGHDKLIQYEEHALRRMQERGISREQIERTVRSPERARAARREGATRFEKRLSKRKRLNVIADVEVSVIRVVTGFWS